MRIAIATVRFVNSVTVAKFYGTQFKSVPGSVAIEFNNGFVVITTAQGVSEYVPLANVVSFTPEAQEKPAEKPAKAKKGE